MFDSRIVNVQTIDPITLLVTPNASVALATLAQAKDFLKIPIADTSEDTFIQDAINVCSEAIEQYCDRIFVQRLVIETIFNHPDGSLVLVHNPVVSIISLTDSYGVAMDQTKFVMSTKGGILRPIPQMTYASGILPSLSALITGFFQQNMITATYYAGYAPADMPYALRRACLEYIKTMRFQRERDPNVAIEAVADVGSTTYVWGIRGNAQTDLVAGTGNVPSTVSDLLSQYKRRV